MPDNTKTILCDILKLNTSDGSYEQVLALTDFERDRRRELLSNECVDSVDSPSRAVRPLFLFYEFLLLHDKSSQYWTVR